MFLSWLRASEERLKVYYISLDENKQEETKTFMYVFVGIMLGRMGTSGVPLVSFCQCLNESVMKIVAVTVW